MIEFKEILKYVADSDFGDMKMNIEGDMIRVKKTYIIALVLLVVLAPNLQFFTQIFFPGLYSIKTQQEELLEKEIELLKKEKVVSDQKIEQIEEKVNKVLTIIDKQADVDNAIKISLKEVETKVNLLWENK